MKTNQTSFMQLQQKHDIQTAHGHFIGGGGQLPPPKNLKLKSWANFEHKLGKNLRNKAIHLNERTKKGKVKALKSPFPAI